MVPDKRVIKGIVCRKLGKDVLQEGDRDDQGVWCPAIGWGNMIEKDNRWWRPVAPKGLTGRLKPVVIPDKGICLATRDCTCPSCRPENTVIACPLCHYANCAIFECPLCNNAGQLTHSDLSVMANRVYCEHSSMKQTLLNITKLHGLEKSMVLAAQNMLDEIKRNENRKQFKSSDWSTKSQ